MSYPFIHTRVVEIVRDLLIYYVFSLYTLPSFLYQALALLSQNAQA